MGMIITHDEKGYQAHSSMSGEKYHKKKYLTADELKALMIEIELYDFFEKVIRIDKDFLNQRHVNGVMHFNKEAIGLQWLIDNHDKVEEEAISIMKKLDVTIGEKEKMVGLDVIDNVLRYCEAKQVYDKLGAYGDFYYKLKALCK